jgi:hypothetical protein
VHSLKKPICCAILQRRNDTICRISNPLARNMRSLPKAHSTHRQRSDKLSQTPLKINSSKTKQLLLQKARLRARYRCTPATCGNPENTKGRRSSRVLPLQSPWVKEAQTKIKSLHVKQKCLQAGVKCMRCPLGRRLFKQPVTVRSIIHAGL